MAAMARALPNLARRPLCSAAAARSRRKQLVLYSKPGCCLCEGLKEKLEAASMLGGDLANVHVEVRNITQNEEWEKRFQYEIPVLAAINADGSEEIVPRMSMRISVEQLHKKLAPLFA